MNILLMPKHGAISASTRHRFMQFIPMLESNNIHVEMEPLFDDSFLITKYKKNRQFLIYLKALLNRILLIRKAIKYDLVIIYKEAFPYLPSFFEWALKVSDIPYILDIDDAVFNQYKNHPNFLVRIFLGNKIEKIAKSAIGVFSCNSYLDEHLKNYNSNIFRIPTIVNEGIFTPKQAEAISNDLVIGWIGTPSTSKYLIGIERALKLVQEKTGCKITIVGSGDLTLDSIEADYVKWDLDNEVEIINTFTVGIMPLDNDSWASGKCGFKLLQYMSCGVPVVASPIGINSELVTQEHNGYLANHEHEWTTYLCKIIQNKALRKNLSKQARRFIVENYSIQTVSKTYLEAIKNATGTQ